MENGLGQLNVPKVPGTVEHATPIRDALLRTVHRPEPGITEPAHPRTTLVIDLCRVDLRHRVPTLHSDKAIEPIKRCMTVRDRAECDDGDHDETTTRPERNHDETTTRRRKAYT